MLIWWSLRRRWNKAVMSTFWDGHHILLLCFFSFSLRKLKNSYDPWFFCYPTQLQRYGTKLKVFKNTLYTPAKKRVKECSLKKIVFVLPSQTHTHKLHFAKESKKRVSFSERNKTFIQPCLSVVVFGGSFVFSPSKFSRVCFFLIVTLLCCYGSCIFII